MKYIDLIGEGTEEFPDYPALNSQDPVLLLDLLPKVAAIYVAGRFYPGAGEYSLAIDADDNYSVIQCQSVAESRIMRIIQELADEKKFKDARCRN